MLDFTELSEDGTDLELLMREILVSRGYDVRWAGLGPDAGRDLICVERRGSFFRPDEKRWLIQCKHNAVANRAVGMSDVDNIVDTCSHHRCQGFLLACSTYPSAPLVSRLEGITQDSSNPVETTYWDAVRIEQTLTTPRGWPLAQRFFPLSSMSQDWRVWATDRPNNWVVNFKGYYFYLNNRIGSDNDNRLETIRRRVEDLEAIPLPDGHCLRLRALYCDDKNAAIKWYIDHMYPNEDAVHLPAEAIAARLGDGYGLEDGHIHSFDVINRCYWPQSDHHDFDHYRYYQSHDGSFVYGLDRPRDMVDIVDVEASDDAVDAFRDKAFEELVSKFSALAFVDVVRSCNAEIECLDRFYKQFHWSSIIEDMALETDRFFSSWLLLRVHDDSAFHALMTYFPQSTLQSFGLTRPFTYLPDDQLSHRSWRDDDGSEGLYELTLRVHPYLVADKSTGRNLLNGYFTQLAAGVDAFRQEHG